jgi:hypothetical protein
MKALRAVLKREGGDGMTDDPRPDDEPLIDLSSTEPR